MSTPNLVVLVGPPAVGKMTVGMALARRTGMRLMHNHQTIDLVLPFFEFGTPPFSRLVGEIRRRLFEEVAGSDLPGLIFTYVWAFDDPEDEASLEMLAAPFRARGGRVLFVELEAPLAVRLARNETPLRLDAKPSKRDVEASRQRLLDMDQNYRMNSDGRLDDRADFLRIDNEQLTPEVVATRIVTHFSLPEVNVPPPATGWPTGRSVRWALSSRRARTPEDPRMNEPRPKTVYEAAGGHDGLLRLAHAWHARVLADEVVSHAFSHGFHPQHTERLAAYWAQALGGPTTYTDRYGSETSVVRIHSGNGSHEEMDQRAIACFDQALEDAGLAGDERLRRVLHDYFAWATTTAMARYPHAAQGVPDGLRIPLWSWHGLVGERQAAPDP